MRIRRTAKPAGTIDPRRTRLSKHFVLSDFLGNHSVYARGFANDTELAEDDIRWENGVALCELALEPLLAQYGPLSVSYGLISGGLSRRIVTYQDPDKPSHHRWDLGAAADVCVHRWVEGEFPTIMDLALPESAVGAPVALAHAVDYMDIPYSRLITYSESPFMCLAVSAREIVVEQPRKAFYENRYQGVKKGKPEYLRASSAAARNTHLRQLQELGLEHPWRGAGYPTYHGGGFRQYHHQRVSKYTVLSDWLFDLKSVSTGAKNVVSLDNENVLDSFAAAGIVYDWIIETLGIPRMSIIAGYVSHLSLHFDKSNDWRSPSIHFELMLPEDINIAYMHGELASEDPIQDGVEFGVHNGALVVNVDVEYVLGLEMAS